MTPENLEDIRLDMESMSTGHEAWEPYARELIDYIDILHEDLRLTRAELVAEKHKCLEYRKENAALRRGQGRASC